MPARIARSSVAIAAPKTVRNKNKKRSLDAYSAASKSLPEQRISKNRLGEVEYEPQQKRRRDDDETGNTSEEEEPRRKKPAKHVGHSNDDIERGSDSEGNEWTLGGLADDDEDSDIDSDEAFGESDDEKFQGFTFRGSSSSKSNKKPKKTKLQNDIDLNEEEESDGDDGDSEDDVGAGFGDEGVDLATMLDDEDDEMLGGKDTTRHDMGEESSDEDDTSDEEDDFSDSQSRDDDDDDDDDVADEERVARNRDMLESMDALSESRQQSEPAPLLSLDDFNEGIKDSSNLVSSRSGKKSAKSGPIAAPLPKRQQDRLDREIATGKAQEQLDRWKETVAKNRRAEFLTFPLQASADSAATVGREKFAPVSQGVPRNELEENIQRIMEESGLASTDTNIDADTIEHEEAALLKSEELATNRLPIEEVMRRRAELRRTRELLFREEIKAKRIAKIKSKSYRRVHRKERERDEQRERQAMEEMGLNAMDETQKEKADRLRAEARMGTKHKDSKWAKSLKASGRANWDEDARDGVYEQARRTEDLKKRIAGKEISDSEASNMSSDDDSGIDNDAAVDFGRLNHLKDDDSGQSKGLAGLKFMKAADERRRRANDENIERIRKELAIQDGAEHDESDDVIDSSLGRAIFGPQAQSSQPSHSLQKRLEFEAPAGSDDELDNEEAQNDIIRTSDSQQKVRGTSKQALHSTGKAGRGWLAESDKQDEKQNAQDQQIAWLRPSKSKSGKSQTVVDEKIELDVSSAKPAARMNTNLKTARAPADLAIPGVANMTERSTTVSEPRAAEDSDAGSEPLNPILTREELNAAMKQRAFAGDNVQRAFEAEKDALALSEDERETSSYMPGWGAWAGEGLSKKDKKVNTRARHNPLFKSKTAGIRQADRRDAKLKNVIISEKTERKGKKYLAPQLPHEFESKEQYERSRRVPVGPEWTTKEVHQRSTRPRVVVKAGVVVGALERPDT